MNSKPSVRRDAGDALEVAAYFEKVDRSLPWPQVAKSEKMKCDNCPFNQEGFCVPRGIRTTGSCDPTTDLPIDYSMRLRK